MLMKLTTGNTFSTGSVSLANLVDDNSIHPPSSTLPTEKSTAEDAIRKGKIA